jgi:hypothetical protein
MQVCDVKRFIMVLELDFHCTAFRVSPCVQDGVLCYKAVYDGRKGDFDQVITACDCPADLSTDLSYITEPVYVLLQSNFFILWWSTFGFQLG